MANCLICKAYCNFTFCKDCVKLPIDNRIKYLKEWDKLKFRKSWQK